MHSQINFTDDWSFCLDPKNLGEETRLFSKLPKKVDKVCIPHIWKTDKSIEEVNVGYYFKTFTLSQDQIYKKFILNFESVYHFSKIWVNESLVGENFGGSIPFQFDISQYVSLTSENLISIRVEKPNKEGFLNDLSLDKIPLGSSKGTNLFFGINGHVQLTMGGIPSVRKIDCYPDYEGDVITLETQFWSPKNHKLEVLYTLISPSGQTDTLPKIVQEKQENPMHRISFKLNNGGEWNLENPKLYQVEVKLTNGSSLKTSFGMRRVEINKSMICLNHKNQPFKGVQYKPKCPFSYMTSHFQNDVKKELTLLKDSGFNLIRSGGFPLNHEVLDLCDSLGIMVIQETTCFDQKSSKQGFQWLRKHIENIINEYGNHPSIVAWGMGSDNGSMVLENGNKLIKFTSNLDPFRPVISNFNSVSIDSNNAEEIDKGKIYSPTNMHIYQFESHRFYLAFPLRSKTEKFLTNYCSYKDSKDIQDGIHGRKSFWEKYNYIKSNLDGKVLIGGLGSGLPNKETSLLETKEIKKYKSSSLYLQLQKHEDGILNFVKKIGLWKQPKDFFKQCQDLLEENTILELAAITTNTQLSGYMFEIWADEDTLYKGLTDWNRNPKPLLHKIAEFNNSPKILPQISSKTPYFGSHFSLDLSLLVERVLNYTPVIEILNAKNKVIASKKLPLQKGRNTVEMVKDITIPLEKAQGFLTCRISLNSGKKVLVQKDFPFLVPPIVDIDKVLSKIDFQGVSSLFIQPQHKPSAKIIVVNKIESLKKEEQTDLIDRVKNGATLIISPLEDEGIKALNHLKIFSTPLQSSYCAWTEGGSYHLANDSSFFKDFKDALLGTLYADILPQWSLEPISKAKVYASCLKLYRDEIKENQTLVSVSLGKGKLVFCQFDVFDGLGQNALVDYFFSRLVEKM